jgi:predicted transcriptional regulator
MSVKEEIVRAMENLPDDATLEDAIDRLYLLYKVQSGIEQADAGQGVTQEEARKRMARWLR